MLVEAPLLQQVIPDLEHEGPLLPLAGSPQVPPDEVLVLLIVPGGVAHLSSEAVYICRRSAPIRDPHRVSHSPELTHLLPDVLPASPAARRIVDQNEEAVEPQGKLSSRRPLF